MKVDPSIDMGTILTILTMLGSAVAIIVGVRVELRNLKGAVEKFAVRMEQYENRLFELTGQVQRLIGQMEPRPQWKRTRETDS